MKEIDIVRFYKAFDTTLDVIGTTIRVGTGRADADKWEEQVRQSMKEIELEQLK